MCLLLRLRKMLAVEELVDDDEMSVDDDVSLKILDVHYPKKS